MKPETKTFILKEEDIKHEDVEKGEHPIARMFYRELDANNVRIERALKMSQPVNCMMILIKCNNRTYELSCSTYVSYLLRNYDFSKQIEPTKFFLSVRNALFIEQDLENLNN